MRRLINIRQPTRLLSDCSCSSRQSLSSSPASKCLVQHQTRGFSSSAPASSRNAKTKKKKMPEGKWVVGPGFDIKPAKKVIHTYEGRNGLVEDYVPEHDPDIALAETPIETKFKAPGQLKSAPKLGRVEDPSYVPALNGNGLEEVGDLSSWWEDDRHYSSALVQPVFVRPEKITDGAVLEAFTRRAVIEALAMREVEGEQALAGTWQEGGRESLLRALEVNIEIGDDGVVALEGDIHAVVQGLKTVPQAGGFDQQVEAIDQSLDPQAEGFDQQVEAIDQSLDQQGEGVDQQLAKAEARDADSSILPPQEALEFRKSWDKSWKLISLEDAKFKFAVNKRIQQLTGHLIPDHKLLAVHNVAGYLSVLVKPPPPKKLVEVIKMKGELTKLPNVAVYPRRVTPLDKEKMVGRWKVIVRELENRELPVTGTGGYSKSAEKKWVYMKP